MDKTKLGDRMKQYEAVNKSFLMKRNPVIIRVDGKAFHTFTRGMKKPFDDIMVDCMDRTARYLCEYIQGCKLAYVQSDEISLLLTDYETIKTQGWFNYNLQKMVSISASMATLSFNQAFVNNVNIMNYLPMDLEDERYYNVIKNNLFKAMFDSRVFSIPKEEVVNYFIWRQKDATRNSIQMVAYNEFSRKQLYKKSCNELQEMLFQEKGINWNDLKTSNKRGRCIVKQQFEIEGTTRNRWTLDDEIPVFTQDREYINKYV